jgi:hypothetical protein
MPRSQINHSATTAFETNWTQVDKTVGRINCPLGKAFSVRPRLIALLSLLLLPACANFQSAFDAPQPAVAPPSKPRPRPAAQAPAAPPPAAAGHATAPSAGPTPSSPGPSSPGSPSPGSTEVANATPAPEQQAAAPVKLTGLTQRETVALLGSPSTETDQPPAKVWRYRGRDCTLQLFFYLDLQRNEFFALHQSVDGAATPAAQQSCIQGLRRDARVR